MRRIIVLRPEALARADGLETPSLDLEAAVLQRPAGVRVSPKPAVPVPVPGLEIARGLEAVAAPPAAYAVEIEFEDDAAERAFVSANEPWIVGRYSNPKIGPLAPVRPDGPIGDFHAARARVNIAPLHEQAIRGEGVRLAVVDTGVDGTQTVVAGGLAAAGFPEPGSSPAGHGTMVALDARLAAPEASILDFPLLRDDGGALDTLLFDAITVYEALLVERRRDLDTPLVVVNSWGVLDRSEDDPSGTPENYGSNPEHPFNVLVAKLVGAGADVLFAAGNCGGRCAFPGCGAANLGAGNGILGANAHPDVITVGAVTVDGELLDYSSEGPGLLATAKPDLAAPSHFSGFGIAGMSADTGTSAACGVAAGVVAALRSKASARGMAPAAFKQALLDHAQPPPNTVAGWNPQTGHGIIDAAATAEHL